ncbi:MAG: tRNA (adenosine(37)-N6)-dimethylallyltransferase MiaA [Alphaproteobacteria bacterium]|nr:tRNA (adenosine(37)-N6)-dimethylallyltransferase MiaA [Alphaproteobacteria bacterium]
MTPAILIHGPTASGKTALGIALANRLDGEIINADAMQVYGDLNVLTARPMAAELSAAPHHLFGHVDAGERHSAGRWVKDASARIAELNGREKVAIVVGGTGLYLQALVEGLSDIPTIPDAARAKARGMVADAAAGAYRRLAEVDPEGAARVSEGDRQRVARALEVWFATGRPLSSFRGEAEPALKAGAWVGVALTPPREAVYARIHARMDRMVAGGALKEAEALWARKLDRDLPAMRAHGMPGFCDHFDGRLGLEEALERCRRDTRRYAKRQLTWITHQFTKWPRIPAEATDLRAKVTAALWGEVKAGF